MKKYFKILSILIVLVLISMIGTINVYAQEAMKITKKTTINSGVEGREQRKFYTNKGVAFCITPNREGPSVGTSLHYVSSTKGGGVAYLLNKVGSSDTDYLITQLAVWKYHNNFMHDEYARNQGKEVVKRALALAAEASNNKNWTTAPTLKLELASVKLSETSDGKSYKSGVIKAIATNNTTDISVSLSGAPSGSKIVDGNGNTVSSVKKSQAFYVVVPASSLTKEVSFTINASTKGKTTYIERYSTGNSDIQELVVLVKKDESVSTSAKVTVTPVVRICKKVGDNTYYGKDGKIVTYEQFDKECNVHYYCKPVGDKYYGKDGKVVSYEQYDKECNEHYYCKPVGDKYYGKDGNVVSYEQYDKECNEHYYCKPVGDKYYGKNGNVVSYEQYDKECNEHYYCKQVGDKYYGKNGNVVTQDQFEKECVHICEIYDNQYYGKWGSIVSASEYKAQCEAQFVPVPDTANTSIFNLLYIVLGSTLLGGTIGAITHFASNKAN